jgi:predicted ester cyclase
MQGISPTNAKLKLPVMQLDRVVNGKIVEHRGLANEVDLMQQLGVVLAP